ncbi:MAG: hypothetical protein IJX86_00630 [Lachnospiraceae bacterium]|nr:hypothetical protein [Lachnospiraceae bacterium]
MNIKELQNTQINKALAYTLGLIYPLYKEKKLNGREYILGCVNHNAGKVTQDELNKHFRDVYKMFKECMGSSAPEIKTNKTAEYTISPKEGFTVLVEKAGVSEIECIKILTHKVQEIAKSSIEIKKEFVKGCFDGRASWDTTAHYLSIDVDRVYERQDLVIEIIESLGIVINNNRRDINHKKNDQIRIKPDSLDYFMSNIGLYSACRTNIVEKAMRLL